MKRILQPRFWLPPLLAAVLTAGAAALACQWTWRGGAAELRAAQQQRLAWIALELQATLARFDYLPALLEMGPGVLELLRSPDNAALQNAASQYLNRINATAGAELLFLVDHNGLAIAADDAGQPGSPFGALFTFRPYVQDALRSGHGRFFGVGITTRRPGFYLSYALPRNATAPPDAAGRTPQPQGVAVVKIGFAEPEQRWRSQPGEVLVLDSHGVVVLTTQERWRYRPLARLPAETLARIAASRAYPTLPDQPLDWHAASGQAGGAGHVRLERAAYLASQRPLEAGAFNIIVLEPAAPLYRRARLAAAAAALGVAALLLAGAVLRLRQRRWQEQQASRAALQAAHQSLETEVQRRTEELRQAQQELLHAEKMAALGQMSAALAHEINQPLAALHTLSDNAQILLRQGRQNDAATNLQRIARLVQRLAAISERLKVFAHKSGEPPQAIAIAQAAAQALQLLERRLADGAVAVHTRIDPPDLRVMADAVRLEQVLTNLLANALDALQKQPRPQIAIHAWAEGGLCRISVGDNGTGIAPALLPHLFEPFATSKPAGAGLGLGLVISAHLVREMGGSISAGNHEDGGARFIIALPLAGAARHS